MCNSDKSDKSPVPNCLKVMLFKVTSLVSVTPLGFLFSTVNLPNSTKSDDWLYELFEPAFLNSAVTTV